MVTGMIKLKKTDNEIDVFLDPKSKTLKIEDHLVFENNLTQVITWNLTQSLKRGDFMSFSWVNPPVEGTFGTPVISPDGNSLTISDLNTANAAKGNLSYFITVDLDGTLYKSVTEEISGASNSLMVRDPIIINK